VESDWIRQTRVPPINHSMVIRRDLVQADPWLVDELAAMVGAAKRVAGGTSPPDGLERNRESLKLLARYAFEQHITPHVFTPDELYARP
jgi:hypothetical protein